MVTALVSALTGRRVRRDIAMTGEVSLRGSVLAIGGLKEKTMAAYSAGVSTVLIPEENIRNLEEIDPLVRESLTFLPCRKATDVLSYALLPKEEHRDPKPITARKPEEPEYPELIPESAGKSISLPLGR